MDQTRDQVQSLNPFAKRDSHNPRSLLAYKILTLTSWFLVTVIDIHFGFNAPAGDDSNRSIWGQNKAHPSPFSLNPYIVDIYWVVLLVLQIGYLYYLFSNNTENVTHAANVGPHFIVNNLLLFAFVLLWVHSHFWIAEIMLILNFINLSSLYFRHPKTPRFIHIAVITGPLAWSYVALFWCGAAMVNAQNLVARIFANVFIWGFLGYGLFFIVAYNDYTVGFELSVLTAALGVHQFFLKIVAFQWIFAFAIMGTLFVASLGVAVPQLFGKEFSFRRDEDLLTNDHERQPLLNDE